MNDPNGLMVVDGSLHLFYQHNPDGPYHHRIHWGHAVSDDLVHWRHEPIALAPTPGAHDAQGCWSGCGVLADGVPTLIYTGIEPQVQCLATSSDGLRTWTKHPEPIVATPPPGLRIYGSPAEVRDPWVWHEADGWHMLLGSGVHADDGAVDGVLLHYRSHDLRRWDYLGIAHRGRFAPNTAVWECPNLFRLDDAHVVLVSEQLEYRHTYVQSGSFDGRTFTPTWTGVTDHGPAFYAGLSVEHDERRLLFGWLKEGRSDALTRATSAWSGVLSLARELRLDPRGRLNQRPAAAYRRLRRTERSHPEVRLEPGSRLQPGVQGDALELLIEAEVPSGGALTVELRATPDRAERTIVRVSGDDRTVSVDTRAASLHPGLVGGVTSVPYAGGDVFRLHLFLDRSVLELFAGDPDGHTACVTERLYPTRSDAIDITVGADSAAVELRALSAWELDAITVSTAGQTPRQATSP